METEVKRAWEQFVSRGQLPTTKIRSVVAQSWQRSAEMQVSFARKQAPVLSEGDLHRRKLHSVDMIAAAVPALQRSRHFLANAGSMLILADESGHIIATEGDARIIDAGRDNHLELGGDWNEERIGTNAIGTALVEKTAVHIHGNEHYCEGAQRWTCAAVPVFNPVKRRLIGVVNVSGPANKFNPQSMALAVSVGSEIEAAMDRQLRMEHEVLLRQFLSKRAVWLNEDMLVLDRYGQIIHSTDESNLKMLLLESGLQEQIAINPPEEWQSRFRTGAANAELDLIKSDGVSIGAIVLARGRSKRVSLKPIHHSSSSERVVSFEEILGNSPVVREAKERARQFVEAGLPVLLEGETGTGKELFARAMHQTVYAPSSPFVPVNCGGIAKDLIASELFGYAKGSFTGADVRGREGKIIAADGGMLCLDEIGELPLELQPYLLRVLEDGVVYPVGSQDGRSIEFQLVSMTNRSLQSEIAAGRFRSDLFYRIAVATVNIPALRDRGDDAALLAEHFARKAASRMGRASLDLTPEALDALCQYDWPGNVRQLRNVVETAVALNRNGRIELEDLPAELHMQSVVRSTHDKKILQRVEETAIREAMSQCNGNLTEAARQLGIARSTLYLRLERYGIAH
ncbi:sigma-54-dependent Fis family transcriptional regulator [Brucella gallinifaecis]|uniref:Sigma-54-dependent Fis family transcriptional regulator n=1 Tax=Brucella gallinifaecis TaxID=215590 RepID=A0A502BSL7_9HYPH|nr:sigma-54-dependent Fis family transcriptional regulator [Brucella gallinifaecis]TPF76810.1 sigma-54-dependent Fis family transcriptional regulator [Brucella gallinifaecis]